MKDAAAASGKSQAGGKGERVGFDMDVKWKIRINGKEYSSPDEIPLAERAIYERALQESAASGRTIAFTTKSTKIVLNGREYGSADEMPDDVRKTYLDLMKAVEAGKIPANATTAVKATGTVTCSAPGGPAGLSRALRPIVPESIPARKLVVGAAVLAALAALYFVAR